MLNDYDARLIALDPTQSFIVQAPAGSGKTGLLVYRMLSLLATVLQPQEVLAITFTRKATAEMRERVLELLRLAEQDESSQNAYEQQGIELAKIVIQRDRELGWQLLDSPHQLQILTIDAFSGRLAGSMPWLSRLGDRPRTTDQADVHYAAAVEQLLAELLENESKLADALHNVMLQLDYNYNKARKLFASMLRQRDQWLRHIVHNDLPALKGVLEHAWQTVANEQVATLSQMVSPATLERLLTLADYAHKNWPEKDRDGALFLEPLLKFDRSVRLLGVAQWRALAQMLLTSKGQSLRRTVDARQGFPRQQEEKRLMTEILLEMQDDDDLLRELSGAFDLPALQFDLPDWQQLEALELVLKALAGLLQLRFRAAGECDHSEVTQRANLALQELNDPTDLALRLDSELKHILVDEFQDTSHAQIELLKRLTRGWTPEQGPLHSLFLVGDPMQSIYRFREADVSLFLQAADNATTGVFDNIAIEPLILSENFRSSSTLVDWFNQTFHTSFPTHNNVLHGAIRYAPATSNKRPAQPAATCLLAADKTQEAALIVESIQHALHDLPDARAQIAVLVRGRNHLLHLLPAIRAAGISYTGVDIQPLAHQQAVIDVLALAKALCRQDDRVAWLGLLRGPWCGLTLVEIRQLSPRPDQSVWQQLCQADMTSLNADSVQRLTRFKNLMTRALEQRQQVDLSSLTRWLWQQLGGPDTLFEAALQDVELVFGLLRDLQRGGDLASLKELANGLEGLFAQPPSPAEAPRVVISTMHKAKGLQFDTVILPALSRQARAQSKEILMWAEYQNARGKSQLLLAPFQLQEQSRSHYSYLRELDKKRAAHETMRLMYVACTRAERRLILVGETKRDKKTAELQPPVKNSLLATIWETTHDQFAESDVSAVAVSETSPPQTLMRLPANYTVNLPPNIAWSSKQPLTMQVSEEELERLDYEWSSEVASVVGTVLHRWLQFNHSRLLDLQINDDLMALWRAELLESGLPAERLSVAMPRLRNAVTSMQADPHARFVFADHHEQRNEYALAAHEEHGIKPYRIDRTFVADGVRWIIDYKSTYTEQADLELFAQRQVEERHKPQLQNYGALMRALDSRPIQLAVYFPLLAQLVSWQYQE